MATHHDDHTQSTANHTAPRRYRRARGLILIATAIGVVAAACSSPSAPSTAAPSTDAPQATPAFTTIGSGLHGGAKPRNDVGRMDGSFALTNLSLSFRPSAAQEADRAALGAAQQDPMSPSYRRFLTPEQYAARFGATGETIAQVTTWLQSQGFDVKRTSRAGTRVSFSGSVAQVEHAFRTEIHRYDVAGERHFALSKAASVPTAIGVHVIGLQGADDFRARAPKHALRPVGGPDYTRVIDAGPPVDAVHSLAPEDFAKIYDVPNQFTTTGAGEYDGDGVTIAIIGQSDFNDDDVSLFRSTFKLPVTSINRVLVPGTGNDTFDEDGQAEASLDLEWSGAVAPNATINYVYTGDNGNFIEAIQYALDEASGSILSASFSLCEGDAADFGLTNAELAAALNEVGQQANLEGISFVAASGDTGAAGCDPNSGEASATNGIFVGFPSSIPSVTSVGGTSITDDDTYWSNTNDADHGSVLTPVPVDVTWNDTFSADTPSLAATGGGASILFKKPVWQTGSGVPSANARSVPDLSFSGGGGNVRYLVAFSYTPADGAPDGGALEQGFYGFSGTSASTPSFAGVLAILNQALVAKSVIAQPGLGNVNPQIYALAAGTPTIVRDVTSGNSCVPCTAGTTDCPTVASAACPIGQYGFAAGAAYDQVTGLGTIDTQNFVNAWATLAPTAITVTATPNPQNKGASVALKAKITSPVTTPAMTGTVSYYDQNFDKVGGTDTVTGNPGTVSGSTTLLPLGTDRVYAIYTGDTNFVGSFTEITIIDLDDAGVASGGNGGTPITIIDAGVDAASIDSGIITLPDAGLLDSGTTTDAGAHDSGTTTDAGHDSGTVTADSGSEDGGSTGDDSGSTGDDDSGITTGDDDDSGTTGDDDSGIVLGDDSGVIITPPPGGGEDGGTLVDASTDGGGNGATGSSSGCGCVTAGHDDPAQSNMGALGGVMLGLAAIARRRRSTKR